MNHPIKKEIVRNGLVLWLEGRDFYNSPPTSSWIDKSGNNNNGTPSGFAYTTSSGSDGSNKVVFDGVDDCIQIANSSSLNSNYISIEMKFNLKARPNQHYLISKNTYNQYKLSINTDGTLYFTLKAGSVITDVPLGIPLLNTDYHVIATYNGINIKVFINGILTSITPKSGTIDTSLSDLTIGKRSDNLHYTNFIMYFARQYNRALSDQESLKNYYASK